ncbi:MAG: hypothetical protein ACOVOR_05035 [Rhabdochlamydiaceae bacterium]
MKEIDTYFEKHKNDMAEETDRYTNIYDNEYDFIAGMTLFVDIL